MSCTYVAYNKPIYERYVFHCNDNRFYDGVTLHLQREANAFHIEMIRQSAAA